MAADEWSPNAYLALLQQQGEEMNFFQAVRLLEGLTDDLNKLRFSVKNSEAFKPNFIDEIKRKFNYKNQPLNHVAVNGFGILGMQGPIPQCYAELLRRAEVDGINGKEDPHQFLDIFHDRIISLLYEIKKQFNPMLFNEHTKEQQLYTLFSSINGLSLQNLDKFLPVKEEKILGFGTLFANRRVGYSALKNILSQYLKRPIEIFPNQGAWRALPKQYCATLSTAKTHLSASILGTGIGIGKHYWDNQAAVKVHIHVDAIERCHALLPGGSEHSKIAALLSFLTDGKCLFYITLVMKWEKIPTSHLSQSAKLKLSQTSWLKSKSENELSAHSTHSDSTNPRFVIIPKIQHDFAQQQECLS